MKQYIGKFVVAAAMALAMSGVAQAKDDNDDAKACSELYAARPLRLYRFRV